MIKPVGCRLAVTADKSMCVLLLSSIDFLPVKEGIVNAYSRDGLCKVPASLAA